MNCLSYCRDVATMRKAEVKTLCGVLYDQTGEVAGYVEKEHDMYVLYNVRREKVAVVPEKFPVKEAVKIVLRQEYEV